MGLKMNKFKKIVVFSLIITLPITVFSYILVTKTLELKIDSYKYQFFDVHPLKIRTILMVEYLDLRNKILYFSALSSKNDANIFLKTTYEKELRNNLPTSAFDDKKGFLFKNGKVFKGKTRFRGDTFYHWYYPQASWRFKLSKNNLIDGVRKLNFIAPKTSFLVNNHLSYILAKEIKLLAPESSIITVGINGIYNGPKMQVEQIDENFLRRNKKMPNDIYKGDNIASSRIIGVDSDIFNTASIWDKASYNNHYKKDNKFPLKRLLLDITENKYDLYNFEEFVSFAMYLDLTGSDHHDVIHNWILYYDNYKEEFSPIIWDSMGFLNLNEKHKYYNIISSPLLSSLYKNYDFNKLKYHKLKEFSLNNKENFVKKMNLEITNVKKILDKANTEADNAGRGYIEPEKLKIMLDNFSLSIKNRILEYEDMFLGKAISNDYRYSKSNNVLRVSVNGNKLINKLNIKLSKEVNVDEVYISYVLNNKTNRNKVLFSAKDDTISIPIELLSNIKIVDDEDKKGLVYAQAENIEYSEATYDFELIGLDMDSISQVSLEFFNNDNQIISINKVPNIKQRSFNGVNSVIKSFIKNDPIIWSGKKSFSGFNIIKENIIIEPGTEVIFDTNATLKVLGKITAIGTKNNPITFKAKNNTKPWNTFALKDAKANGSIFKHVVFKDGSGDKGNLHEYTAMLSIHNVKDFIVEDCEFYDSHRTDDMVHVIYSNGKFKNTKFVRSLSDALDVDISNVIIDNCEFIDSGNDAIDLMTTNAIVTNTRFTNSADKGISIGEGSNLLAVNNHIQGSEIGMQSKDTSKAYIYNTSFMGNKKAVDAYHKNWRYSEGGTIILEHCVFDKNILNATVGKKSKVIINSSYIDTPNKFDTKSLRKKKIIISDDDFINYELKEPLFEKKMHLISKERRGCHE